MLVGIDLTDDDFATVRSASAAASGSKSLTELLVDGCKILAVAAPGRVELYEGGFAGFKDEPVEVFGNEIEDGGGRGSVGGEDGEGGE